MIRNMYVAIIFALGATDDQEIKTIVKNSLIRYFKEILGIIIELKSDLNSKVDKITGKGLSTNDFTTELKTKLEGLSNYTLPIASSSILGGFKVGEGLRILKSPAAGINTMESALDLMGLMNPYNYEAFAGEEAILQSGRYKGESRAYRLFFESPIIPMNKTIYRGLHPEEGIPFFKQ